MGFVIVALGDLSRGLGFVKGRGRAAREKQKTARLSLAVFCFSSFTTLTKNFSFSLLRYRK